MPKKKTPLRCSYDKSFYNGLLDSFVKSLTTGNFLTLYIVALGGGAWCITLIKIFQSLSTLFHFLISYLIEKGRDCKKITIFTSFLFRFFLLLTGFSFLLQNRLLGLVFFIICYTSANFFSSICGISFWVWMKKIISPLCMTSFLAHRIKYILLVKTIAISIFTFFLFLYHKFTNLSDDILYAFVFFITAIIGFYANKMFLGMVKVSTKTQIFGNNYLSRIKEVINDSTSRKLVLSCSAISMFTYTFPPFFMLFLLKSMNLNSEYAIFITLFQNLIDMLFVKKWCYLAKFHTIPYIAVKSLYLFLLSILLLLVVYYCQSFVFLFLLLSSILMGIANSGINLANSDIIISYIPHNLSSVYMTLNNIVSGLYAIICPVFATLMMKFFGWDIFFIYSIGIILFVSKLIKQLNLIMIKK